VISISITVLVPALAAGAGPVRFADGQPDNDSTLSALTPAEAAFVRKKLAMAAAAVGAGAAAAGSPADGAVSDVACEFDPCEPAPPTPAPSASSTPAPPATAAPSSSATPAQAPPLARTLGTKARQQNNYYYCGPASGQVVINWSRGITSGTTNGEDPTTNWRRQSKIAEWMGTTKSGTGGANLAAGLNNPNAVLKPTSDWVYVYAENGTVRDLYGKIITDVATFGMPLVLATAPHISGAGVYYLESWPTVYAEAHHWIVLRGYDGIWGNGTPIIIKYQDSSGGFGGTTGSFDDSLSVIWQVSAWNQGGHVVW
jgi:hypothetical protein